MLQMRLRSECALEGDAEPEGAGRQGAPGAHAGREGRDRPQERK